MDGPGGGAPTRHLVRFAQTGRLLLSADRRRSRDRSDRWAGSSEDWAGGVAPPPPEFGE
jgi:hypothetical protein